jgi:NitT/TauT family transport system substrate-binding protein
MKIVAGYAVGRPDSNGTIVKTDSGINSAADLQGKTIAVVSLQSLQAVMTKEWITAKTGQKSTAKMVALPFAEMVAAVESGKVDAAAVPGSLAVAAKATGKMKDVGSSIYEVLGPSATAFYTATSSFISQHQDAIAQFSKAMDEASRQFADPAVRNERNKLMTDYCKTPIDAIAKTPEYDYTGYVDMSAFTSTVNKLKGFGTISSNIDAQAAVIKSARK